MTAVPEDVPVCDAGPGEVAALAALHRRVFPDYQSSQLGERFCRALLERYGSEPDARVLVAPGPTGPLGYLVSCPPRVQRAVNDALLVRSAVAALGQLVRSPRRAVAQAGGGIRRARRAVAARTGRSAGGGGGDGGAPATGAAAETGRATGGAPSVQATRVVLVGVDPGARGRGVGDALLAAFAERAAADGFRTADLVVAADNVAAHRAYERRGWRPVADAEGRPTRYELELGPVDPAGPAPSSGA